MLVGPFPPDCVWPCEAACSEEDGEIRESTVDILGCLPPWWMVDCDVRKLRGKQGEGMSAFGFNPIYGGFNVRKPISGSVSVLSLVYPRIQPGQALWA